jgi:glycosyltransferase involved in cell wall biosynthesis
MRIAIDANPIFLNRAGIGNYTYQLVRQLLRIDRESDYFLYNTVTKDLVISGLSLGENGRVACFPRSLSRWRARRDRIDVYHGTSFRLWAEGSAGSVVTIHDLALRRFPQFSKRLFGERWSIHKTRKTLERASRIIADSENTAKDLSEFYRVAREKIRVIYLGVGEEFLASPPSESLEAVRSRYTIPGDYLLFLGGADPRKNLERLLEAFSILLKNVPALTLVATGGMGRRAGEMFDRISRLGIGKNVLITGHVPAPDLRSLYRGARLFVYPSLYEGFGMPVLEAMASGVPVVTSNTASVPEVAGDAACLVDPCDIAALAEAMRRVLMDEDFAARLRARGLERVKAFSWEKTARETLSVYHEVMESPNG